MYQTIILMKSLGTVQRCSGPTSLEIFYQCPSRWSLGRIQKRCHVRWINTSNASQNRRDFRWIDKVYAKTADKKGAYRRKWMKRMNNINANDIAIWSGIGIAMLSSCVAYSNFQADHCVRASFLERRIGEYENRLRKYSTPEKVFEYFASVSALEAHNALGSNKKATLQSAEEQNAMLMTPEDFVRSIVPYSPRIENQLFGSGNFRFRLRENQPLTKTTRAEYKELCLGIVNHSDCNQDINCKYAKLRAFRRRIFVPFTDHMSVLREIGVSNGEFYSREPFMSLIDRDGDGLISFFEFLTFRVLLSMPRTSLEEKFAALDKDNNRTIDRDLFIDRIKFFWFSAAVSVRNASPENLNHFVDQFFRGQDVIDLEKLASFTDELDICVARLEFETFDFGLKGWLNPSELVLYIATSRARSSAESRVIHFADSLAESPADNDPENRIYLPEFFRLTRLLSQFDKVSNSFQYGSSDICDELITKEQFQAGISKALPDHGLSTSTLNLLFTLLDRDGNGGIDAHEMLDLLQNNIGSPRQLSKDSLIHTLSAQLRRWTWS